MIYSTKLNRKCRIKFFCIESHFLRKLNKCAKIFKSWIMHEFWNSIFSKKNLQMKKYYSIFFNLFLYDDSVIKLIF